MELRTPRVTLGLFAAPVGVEAAVPDRRNHDARRRRYSQRSLVSVHAAGLCVEGPTRGVMNGALMRLRAAVFPVVG
jgi:hypothetical protein